ncbi:Permeases of the drug/metabolite transporter (DMT) superfamily protein [Elusimicrobium minutum Pei191]|uniref:Permeases of the drug/metabolite transporter (DMT) superfamily protein n=1 Tax=Elusimicrobium minutum (strain Pei191) TaxID=445932 RepID=B2KB54_ELUMP|nr:DMT family transporter [Elusimicrobium minutum]ACC97813.1 Permeases of the drug/metabolite transporter (DMT) superfamily protein [Elusimicrobium minutum Pei191]
MIYIKLFASILFWSLTFYFVKTALAECGVTTLVFARSVLGLLVVTLFLREFKWLKTLTKKDWLRFFFLAMVGVVIQQNVQGYATMHTSTNHAGWLVALSPIFVAFTMVAFFKERLPKDKMMGFIICILGVLLIFLSKQTFVDGSSMSTLKGDLIFVATAVNWVFYVVPMSIWFKNMPNLRITFCLFLAAVTIMLPIEIVSGSLKDFAHMGPRALSALAYLGIFCSGFAFIFYNEGIEKIGPSKASAFIYAQPLFTMVFGYILLGEVISKEAFIGGALILCGLYLINVRRKRLKRFYITLIRYFRV